MSIKKFAVAAYDDEAVLFPAVKKVRSSGYKIHDVYTPFAVHGLDEALGEKESDLHIAGFIYGITGTSTALGFMSWIFTTDWPQNFGGKPHFPFRLSFLLPSSYCVVCGSRNGAYVLLPKSNNAWCKKTYLSSTTNR
jgi:hypothetical protein